MSYKVSIHNKYPDGSKLSLTFDTNSGLLHEASKDADVETIYERQRLGKDPFEKPVFSRRTFKPIG
jgi:hypothetical protein